MAITYHGELAEGAEKAGAGDAVLVVTFTAVSLVGDDLFLGLGYDNLIASTPTVSTVVDSRGNTWTAVPSGDSDSSTAIAAGSVRCSVWRCPVTIAHQVGDTVTVTLSAAVAAKAGTVICLRGTDTANPAVSTSRGTADGATTRAVTAIGQAVVGFVADENNAVPAADTDTTDGSWSAVVGVASSGGGGATNAAIGCQVKIVTGTTTQSLQMNTAADWSSVLLLVSVGPTNAQAEAASASGVANAKAPGVSATAGEAAATGTGVGVSASVTSEPQPTAAAADGVGLGASVDVFSELATAAVAAAVANDGQAHVEARAGVAVASGVALGPTVSALVTTDEIVWELGDPGTVPTVDTEHFVVVRARVGAASEAFSVGESSVGGDDLVGGGWSGVGSLAVELRQGATVIESWGETLTTSFQTFSHELDEANVANITDYNDLRVAIVGTGTQGETIEISQVYAEFPVGVAVTNAAAGVAPGPGTATTETVTIMPLLPVAVGSGVALDATAAPVVVGPAEVAVGTGTAVAPTVLISPIALDATAAAVANGGAANVAATAGVASAVGVASAPALTTITNPDAGVASATGVSSAPSISVAPLGNVASGAGTANDATATVEADANANAEAAAATGAANQPTPSLATSPDTGAATGTAGGPTSELLVAAVSAAGTGVAPDATGATVVLGVAEVAAATGVAPDAASALASGAEAGTGSGTSAGPGGTIDVGPVVAVAAGTAPDAAASTVVETNAPAEAAAAAGAALGLSAALTVSADAAAATGAADGPTPTVAPAAGVGAGTGVAPNGTAETLQYIRPNGDIVTAGWTTHLGGTANLYAVLDEADADDADYVTAAVG